MAFKALSGVTQGASRFNRLPNGFTRSSKLTQTLPIDGVNKATIRVVIAATAAGSVLSGTTHNGVASCQVNLSASAAGFNTATQVPDETTNGNTMTLLNGPVFTSDSAIGNRAVAFDPTTTMEGGRIDTNYESVFQSPFSLSVWTKPDDGVLSGSNEYIFSAYSGNVLGVENWRWDLRQIGGKIRAGVVHYPGAGSENQSIKETTSNVYSDGAQSSYTHIVVTFDSSAVPTIYVNGSAVALTSISSDTLSLSNYDSTNDCVGVGGVFTGSSDTVPIYAYDGKLDDISLWSTELTSTQVSNLYNSGSGTDLTGSSDLEGWWKMGDSNNLEVTHSGTATVSVAITASADGTTAQTHSGTASCQVNLTASASGSAISFNSYAISCDGTDDYIDLNSNFASVFNSDFSMAFWINLPEGQPTGSGHSATSNSNVFGISNSGNAHRFFALIGRGGQSDAGKLRVYYKAGGTQVHARSASAFFSSGATGWVHVVITVEEGSDGIKMYKDGSAVSVDEADNSMSSVTMSNFAGNVDMVFGASNRSGTPNYEVDADFDEIAIFSTALSASQVSTIYNGGDAYDLDGYTGLEGWWRFEENSGTSIADSSTNSNAATLVNGPTFVTDVPEAWANTRSLEFDGTNDYLSTSLVTDTYDFKDGFSASLWVYLDDVSTTQDFFGRYGASTGRFYFGITGTNVRAAIGTSFDTSTLSHGMSTGTWYHVAYTFSGGSSGTFTYYLNGSSIGTISFTWTSDSSSYEPMHIGGLKNGSNLHQNPTNGKLDELALYSSTLSASDITAIYNSGAPADQSSDSNLVAYWRMEEGSGTSVADSSSNSNTATLNNGPTFSTDTPS